MKRKNILICVCNALVMDMIVLLLPVKWLHGFMVGSVLA